LDISATCDRGSLRFRQQRAGRACVTCVFARQRHQQIGKTGRVLPRSQSWVWRNEWKSRTQR